VFLADASDVAPSTFPCCDNCILRKKANPGPDSILMDVEMKVLLLINCIQVGHSLTPDTTQEVIDINAPDIVMETNTSPTHQRGERLKICHEALA
jgi:hypothetical protein